MSYISFPREVAMHQKSYIKPDGEAEFRINTNANENLEGFLPIIDGQANGRVSVWDIIIKAVFKDCFINKFVYEFCVEVPEHFDEKMAVINKYDLESTVIGCEMNHDAMDRELDEINKREWFLQNQVLYKYLYDNMFVGEFIEIYKSWIEIEGEDGMIFSPPTSEIVITLKDVLSLPYLIDNIEYGERFRLTIHRME